MKDRIPLIRVDYNVKITNGIAETTLTQEYKNN
jgi:hypothetical protein